MGRGAYYGLSRLLRCHLELFKWTELYWYWIWHAAAIEQNQVKKIHVLCWALAVAQLFMLLKTSVPIGSVRKAGSVCLGLLYEFRTTAAAKSLAPILDGEVSTGVNSHSVVFLSISPPSAACVSGITRHSSCRQQLAMELPFITLPWQLTHPFSVFLCVWCVCVCVCVCMCMCVCVSTCLPACLPPWRGALIVCVLVAKQSCLPRQIITSFGWLSWQKPGPTPTTARLVTQITTPFSTYRQSGPG
jgi:hypothetical protein